MSAGDNLLGAPPGKYGRRLKLKGIDGGSHKRWRMWFNSKQRVELTSLTYWDQSAERQAYPYGCNQYGAAWLSSARAVRC